MQCFLCNPFDLVLPHAVTKRVIATSNIFIDSFILLNFDCKCLRFSRAVRKPFNDSRCTNLIKISSLAERAKHYLLITVWWVNLHLLDQL